MSLRVPCSLSTIFWCTLPFIPTFWISLHVRPRSPKNRLNPLRYAKQPSLKIVLGFLIALLRESLNSILLSSVFRDFERCSATMNLVFSSIISQNHFCSPLTLITVSSTCHVSPKSAFRVSTYCFTSMEYLVIQLWTVTCDTFTLKR